MPVVKDVLIRILELTHRQSALSLDDVDLSRVHTVLVIRQHDMLGDFLLATPVFRALRSRFPTAHIGVLVRDYFADAVAHNPFVDEILVLPKGRRQWRPGRLISLFRKLYRRWDLTIVLNTVSHSLSSDLIAVLSSRHLVLGSADRVFRGTSRNFFYNMVAPHSLPGAHQTTRNLDIVRSIGAHTDDATELMCVLDAERRDALDLLRRLGLREDVLRIAMHVGAGKVMNRWPVDRFARLAQLLYERLNAQIVLFWGPRETDLAAEFCRLISFEPVRVSPAGLRMMAACFTHCSLLVCNDTGIMHVCAGVGVPLVAVFGPTPPDEWKPTGDSFVAVRGANGTVDGVQVDSVYTQIASLLQAPQAQDARSARVSQ